MRCLICFEVVDIEVNWSNFLRTPENVRCCHACETAFRPIKPTCPKCGREDSNGICFDCERWAKDKEDPLKKNVSLFHYNEFAKEWVARWKYRGDYVMLSSISRQTRQLFQSTGWKDYVLVSVPLSDERIRERGFNQSEALIRMLGKEPVSAFTRKGTEKQSKRRRQDRVDSINPFSLIQPVQGPVVLVDDIYTTGTTIRHLASLIKESGCPIVYAFTLFR